MKVCLQYSLIVQKCNSHASSPICSAKLSQPPPYILIRLFFCSLNDLFKVAFLKAEIVIGLAKIKTFHQHMLQVTYIAAKVSNKTGLIFFFRAQTCNCFSIDLHYSFLSRLWYSQLFNHNEAAIELQIGPSSINKQE